jgi:glycosyltransferase involved in cell wall biosynthesis
MRIGLDLRMSDGGSGIGRYITELSHQILSMDKTNEYVLFFRDESQSEKYKEYGHKVVITGIEHYTFAEQWKLPSIMQKEHLDVVHFPHFNVPIFYRGKFVVTIHDLTHTLIPGKKKSHFIHRLAYHWVFWNAVKSAHRIIAVSEATKKALLDYYHYLNHDIYHDKIQVVYEGFNEKYKMMDKLEAFAQVSNSFGVTKPYILYVGDWRRYKNLTQLANAFDKLIDQGLDLEWVLVGKKDPFYPEIEEQIFSIKHKDRIKALGRISDEDLKAVYNGALLFVLPSSMEGFGLTLLEAAACGVPIACSDIPSLREVAGQGAEYFDPNNLQNMIEVIKNLVTNERRLEELANLALSRSKHFSWKKAAEETLEVYTK